jgi:5'-methylthioadenosine phosphorylase
MIGVISGSGLYEIEGSVVTEKKWISTPYGSPSDSYIFSNFAGSKIIFLPRHGLKHTIPPHKINYRANLWGFRQLGVRKVISIGATGGISSGMKPGTIVVPDQIIDMTTCRDSTYYDGGQEVMHVDFTAPYCNDLRKSIIAAAKNSGINMRKKGTYICTNGPRLETKAEIRFFSIIGADIVGMTAMPEASLARELEICYAGIAVVTNYAAGITKRRLTAREVVDVMHQSAGQVCRLLTESSKIIPSGSVCVCQETLREAKV